MKNIKVSCIVLILCAWSAPAATAVTVDFDAFPAGTIITNQYPDVTFSAESGFDNKAVALAGTFNTSIPNFIGVGPVGNSSPDYVHETYLSFTKPVNNLDFLAVGVDNSGAQAQVDVFQNGVFTTTVNIVGNGTPFTPDLVNLTSFTNVTRIELHSIIDPAGIAWDDFHFTPVVPEPSAALIALCGALGWVCTRVGTRRRIGFGG